MTSDWRCSIGAIGTSPATTGARVLWSLCVRRGDAPVWNPSAIDAEHIVPTRRHNVYLFTIILGCLLRDIARLVDHGLYNCTTNNEALQQRVPPSTKKMSLKWRISTMGYELGYGSECSLGTLTYFHFKNHCNMA